MNTQLLQMFKQIKDLNSIVPKAALDFHSRGYPKKGALDFFPAIDHQQLNVAKFTQWAAAAAKPSENLLTTNFAASGFIQPAVSELIKKQASLNYISSLHQRVDGIAAAVAGKQKLSSAFLSTVNMGHYAAIEGFAKSLFPVSNIGNTLAFTQINRRSFILPDFDEVELNDSSDESGKIIIQIDPKHLRQTIMSLYNDPNILKSINPHKFEDVVAELLRHHGYKVKQTKKTRDGGFDMVIEQIQEDGTPFKAIVECKRFNKKIDVSIIRCFSAVAYREKIKRGIIVTSSTFTRDAIDECKLGLPADLTLKNKKDLLGWAGSYLGKMPYVDLYFN